MWRSRVSEQWRGKIKGKLSNLTSTGKLKKESTKVLSINALRNKLQKQVKIMPSLCFINIHIAQTIYLRFLSTEAKPTACYRLQHWRKIFHLGNGQRNAFHAENIAIALIFTKTHIFFGIRSAKRHFPAFLSKECTVLCRSFSVVFSVFFRNKKILFQLLSYKKKIDIASKIASSSFFSLR